MDIDEENNSNGVKRRKKVLNPTDDDDRVTSEMNSADVGGGVDNNNNKTEDMELMGKSDREIAESVARIKRNLQSMVVKLPDGGQKLKANLMRHERELERRKKLQLEKADNGCDETIHLSDHSDDGASHGKRKSSSKYDDLVRKKMEQDQKDSRTVCAFETDLPCINRCQGRKPKAKSQPPDKGRSRKTSLNCRKKINSNDEHKDGDSPTSFSEPISPQDTPSRNLRPRSGRSYHLVDEEPAIQKFMLHLDPSVKDGNIYYPSKDDPNAVEVDYTHITCLAPEACLSSIIMNYYIRYLQQQSSSSEIATCRFHFFNTYFYNKLEKLSYKEDSFLKFRKWWKGVSLFEKAYILLPVHENAHWSLVIICLPDKEDELGPTLLHLDSLGLHDSMSLFDNIKRFLKEECSYLTKSKTPVGSPVTDEICENLDQRVDHKRVTVPQQKNDYDCGLFVLLYMERFIKEAPERFRKKDLSMFSRQWFRPQEASKLRGKIYDLLVEEFKKAKEKESASSPKS